MNLRAKYLAIYPVVISERYGPFSLLPHCFPLQTHGIISQSTTSLEVAFTNNSRLIQTRRMGFKQTMNRNMNLSKMFPRSKKNWPLTKTVFWEQYQQYMLSFGILSIQNYRYRLTWVCLRKKMIQQDVSNHNMQRVKLVTAPVQAWVCQELLR